ncbi:hypothetical protein BDR06DRAFT_956076, partial [Suillus hirtellus]
MKQHPLRPRYTSTCSLKFSPFLFSLFSFAKPILCTRQKRKPSFSIQLTNSGSTLKISHPNFGSGLNGSSTNNGCLDDQTPWTYHNTGYDDIVFSTQFTSLY